jgi:hypothetical protein
MFDIHRKNIIPVVVGIILAIIAGIIIYLDQKSKSSSKEMSLEAAAQEAVTYINENLLMSGLTASLLESSDAGSIYKLRLAIKEGETALGELDSFVSKDGKFLFPEGYDMSESLDFGIEQDSGTEVLLSPEEASKFVDCLEKANFVIYGANWCSWTSQLVQMLGGQEAVEPIYVECTEETDLCQEKEILGYPTILINGEQYEKERTFQGFSEATSCPAPVGSENLNSGNPSGGC